MKDNKEYGHEMALATSSLLTFAMLPKGIKTGKPMPLVLGIVGLANAAYYGKKVYDYAQ